MTSTFLRCSLADYLAMRRALGYRYVRPEKLLGQFLTYLEDRGETTLRIDSALTWATLPSGTNPSGWAGQRLSTVRRFAVHLRTIDPATEVPPRELIPWRPRRATPYLYTDDEVAALMAAAQALRLSHQAATYQALIGVLAITGMRVGEALRLDREDLDLGHGLLIVRGAKFGKSREIPLHASAVMALDNYLHRDDRPRSAARTSALFVSTAGTRLYLGSVWHVFQRLVGSASLTPRSAACRPRLHDLRHRFAVCTLLDAYRQGKDPAVQVARLSTYLGHVDPKHTYWYLSGAPELLQLASDRLERCLGGAS